MNITGTRIAGIFAAGLTAAAFAGLVVIPVASATEPAREPIVLMESTSDDPAAHAPMDRLVADLKARGWTADPADGCECLYPPR